MVPTIPGRRNNISKRRPLRRLTPLAKVSPKGPLHDFCTTKAINNLHVRCTCSRLPHSEVLGIEPDFIAGRPSKDGQAKSANGATTRKPGNSFSSRKSNTSRLPTHLIGENSSNGLSSLVHNQPFNRRKRGRLTR